MQLLADPAVSVLEEISDQDLSAIVGSTNTSTPLVAAVERLLRLGVDEVVLHPGAVLGSEGARAAVEELHEVLAAVPQQTRGLTLERG